LKERFHGSKAHFSNVEALHGRTVCDWRNPVGVVDLRCLNPRVASVRAGPASTRHPWALRRNPLGILLRRPGL
jgi:hypothetical protein